MNDQHKTANKTGNKTGTKRGTKRITKTVNIKDSVRRLDDYRVPRDFTRVKLNQNESPFDFPEPLKKEINKRLLETAWNRYPDNFAEQLVEKIAAYTGFPADGIVVGNSSNELIQAAIYSYSDSGGTIVVSTPGFPIYKRVAAVMNIETREVAARDNFEIDVDGIVAAAANASMVLLASPDNPTGNVLNLDEIAFIAANIPGVLLLDEAYYEFHRQTAQALIKTFSNIIIIRTFSKAFNLAGIRLGYMLGDQKVVTQIRKAKLPFSVGMFQQVAGVTALEHRDLLQNNVEKIIDERERVMAELKQIPFMEVFPSAANFILFRCRERAAKDVFNILYEKNVILRYYESPRLRDCLRVTIGTAKENDSFLGALKSIP